MFSEDDVGKPPEHIKLFEQPGVNSVYCNFLKMNIIYTKYTGAVVSRPIAISQDNPTLSDAMLKLGGFDHYGIILGNGEYDKKCYVVTAQPDVYGVVLEKFADFIYSGWADDKYNIVDNCRQLIVEPSEFSHKIIFPEVIHTPQVHLDNIKMFAEKFGKYHLYKNNCLTLARVTCPKLQSYWYYYYNIWAIYICILLFFFFCLFAILFKKSYVILTKKK